MSPVQLRLELQLDAQVDVGIFVALPREHPIGLVAVGLEDVGDAVIVVILVVGIFAAGVGPVVST